MSGDDLATVGAVLLVISGSAMIVICGWTMTEDTKLSRIVFYIDLALAVAGFLAVIIGAALGGFKP